MNSLKASIPPLVDENTDPAVLKGYIKEKLMADTINPHFKIRVSDEFLKAKTDCLSKVQSFYNLVAYEGDDPCVSCNLRAEWECTRALREYFDMVRVKVTSAMFGEGFQRLESTKGQRRFEADLKVRYYPERGPRKLGAHVDGNFMTFLWSDLPGLQFPKETPESGLSPTDIRAIGLPSLCPPTISLKDEMWEDVAQHSREIVITLGNGFFDEEIVKSSEFSGINCPVLHRVSCSLSGDRFSIPYLFSLV